MIWSFHYYCSSSVIRLFVIPRESCKCVVIRLAVVPRELCTCLCQKAHSNTMKKKKDEYHRHPMSSPIPRKKVKGRIGEGQG